MVSLLCQWSIDRQNLLANFPALFDVDLAVGDQQDKLGYWIGVSRQLNQTIDVPTAEDNFQRANGALGPNWTTGNGSMQILNEQAVATTAIGWSSSFWTGAATDTFTRANENPLNPAAWEVAPTISGASSFAPLQIIADQCIATTLTLDCAEVYVGIPFGPDQFSEITLGAIASGGSVGLFCRASADGFYSVDVGGPLGAGTEIDLVIATTTGENLLGSWIGTVNIGDTVALKAVGTTITVYHNGTAIITITDSTMDDGLPGIFCSPSVVVTDSAITNWTSGPTIFSNDQFAKAYISTSAGPIGPAVRMTAGGNFYAFVSSPSSGSFLYKVVAGFTTEIGVALYTAQIGDLYTLEVQGDVLTAKVNGNTLISAINSTLPTGTPGIAGTQSIDGNAASLWLAGSLPGVSVLDDEDYRILQKLFIAQNAWDGTVPGIYDVWNSVFAAEGYQILIQDNQDMTMTVVFINPPTSVVILALFTNGYFLMRPAGVRITGYFQPSQQGVPIFGLDVENSTISGLDVGAWMIPIES